MRVRLKGIFKVRKRLADGSIKDYHYAYRGGPPLQGIPGSAEYVESYYDTDAARKLVRKDNLDSLIDQYQDSNEYKRLAAKSRVDYARALIEIRKKFGDCPYKVLDDKRIRGDILRWRDVVAERKKRKADYLMAVFARVLSWGVERGHLINNQLKNRGRVWDGNRADIVWSDDEVKKVLAVASPPLALAMILGLETGQRQGDILALQWTNYDGHSLSLTQSKTGKALRIPVSDRLRAALDGTRKESFFIVTSSDGRRFTSDGFRSSWRKACHKAGIKDRTFHDLRGTAVTNFAKAGCTEIEIASITGHTVGQVKSVMETNYLNLNSEVAENAIRKYEERTKLANQKANRDE